MREGPAGTDPSTGEPGAPRVGLLDYGMGNLHSARKGLEAAGAEVVVAASPSDLDDAVAALVLPGVGHFGRCMQNLREAGFDGLIRSWVDEGRPFLGICLGLQLLYEGSEEAQEEGLGIIPSWVRRLPSEVRVPHMGWNTVRVVQASARSRSGGGTEDVRDGGSATAPVLRDGARCEAPAGPGGFGSCVRDGEYFYFVHSYAALDAPEGSDAVLVTSYGVDFVAGFQRGSLWATQFHPEKSGASGIELLRAFVRSLTMPDGADTSRGDAAPGKDLSALQS